MLKAKRILLLMNVKRKSMASKDKEGKVSTSPLPNLGRKGRWHSKLCQAKTTKCFNIFCTLSFFFFRPGERGTVTLKTAALLHTMPAAPIKETEDEEESKVSASANYELTVVARLRMRMTKSKTRKDRSQRPPRGKKPKRNLKVKGQRLRRLPMQKEKK